jgi:TonB family protein
MYRFILVFVLAGLLPLGAQSPATSESSAPGSERRGFLSYTQTLEFILKSAENSSLFAQFQAGTIYARDGGVAQDYIQAYKWLTLYIEGSVNKSDQFQEATVLRDSVAMKMTPPQIVEAERLAGEWELRHMQGIGDDPYQLGDWGLTNPITLTSPKPSYTDEARKAHIWNAVVILQCIVRKDGTVDGFKILRGAGYGLDESAIQTIATAWRFKPGTVKGKLVDVPIVIDIQYTMSRAPR